MMEIDNKVWRKTSRACPKCGLSLYKKIGTDAVLQKFDHDDIEMDGDLFKCPNCSSEVWIARD